MRSTKRPDITVCIAKAPRATLSHQPQRRTMAQIHLKPIKVQYIRKHTLELNKNPQNASVYVYSSNSWVTATLKNVFFMWFFPINKVQCNKISKTNNFVNIKTKVIKMYNAYLFMLEYHTIKFERVWLRNILFIFFTLKNKGIRIESHGTLR